MRLHVKPLGNGTGCFVISRTEASEKEGRPPMKWTTTVLLLKGNNVRVLRGNLLARTADFEEAMGEYLK